MGSPVRFGPAESSVRHADLHSARDRHPNNGGSAVTAGGLIFIAAATDDLIKAIDIKTGEILWSDVLPAGGQATPIVYEQDGKEYLVIMAGGHHFMMTPPGDSLIARAPYLDMIGAKRPGLGLAN